MGLAPWRATQAQGAHRGKKGAVSACGHAGIRGAGVASSSPVRTWRAALTGDQRSDRRAATYTDTYQSANICRTFIRRETAPSLPTTHSAARRASSSCSNALQRQREPIRQRTTRRGGACSCAGAKRPGAACAPGALLRVRDASCAASAAKGARCCPRGRTAAAGWSVRAKPRVLMRFAPREGAEKGGGTRRRTCGDSPRRRLTRASLSTPHCAPAPQAARAAAVAVGVVWGASKLTVLKVRSARRGRPGGERHKAD